MLQKSSLQVEMVKVSRFFLIAFYMSELASTGYPDFFHQPQIEGRIIWGENRVDYSLRVILLRERFEDFGVTWSEHRWFLWELWQQIYIHSNLEVTFSRCLSSHCFTFLYYIIIYVPFRWESYRVVLSSQKRGMVLNSKMVKFDSHNLEEFSCHP